MWKKACDYTEDVDVSKLRTTASYEMLCQASKLLFFYKEGYPETLLQVCILRTLESVPSEPKPPQTFI